MIGATAPVHLRTMVMEERIARQIDASVIFAAGNFTFAVVLAIALSPFVHPLFVWPWFALTVSLSAMQLMQWRTKRRSTRRSHSSRTVASIVQKNLIFGVIWGVFGAVAVTNGTIATDVLLFILLTITISGGVMLNAMIPLAAVVLYLCAGVVPMVAVSTKYPDVAVYMLILCPVLLALIAFAARQNFLVGIQFVQREFELLETMTRLENATREKSAFVASTSHELRTPLNAIIGFSEVIRDEVFGKVSPPRYGEYVKDIHGSARHLLGVINDLLDLSRIETGNAEITLEWTNLSELLAEATAMVASLAESRNIAVTTREIDSDLMVRTDMQRFRQVVLNILSNAIKYSNEGSQVTISLDTGRKGDLVLSVKDQGLGMNPIEVRQALTPFGRTESSVRTGEQGSGLGLPITRHLMQVLEGELQIDRAKGQGTTVRILLPAEFWATRVEDTPTGGSQTVDAA
jgi:signal transduction histidine kinase